MTSSVLIALPVLGALVLAWNWRPRHAVAPGVWILLGCYGVLGLAALWIGLRAQSGAESATWQIWKPSLLYGVLAAVMIYAPLRGWGHPAKAVIGVYFVFSNREWHWINLAMAVFCAGLGILNIVVAYGYTGDEWNGFRFSCMMNLLALLLLRMAFVWMDLIARVAGHIYASVRARLP